MRNDGGEITFSVFIIIIISYSPGRQISGKLIVTVMCIGYYYNNNYKIYIPIGIGPISKL